MGRKRWISSILTGVIVASVLWMKVGMGQAGADDAQGIRSEQAFAAPAVTYQADVKVDAQAHTVKGTMAVHFDSQDEQAYFHLYANAFQEAADLSGANWEQVLGKQREPGRIQILEVRVNGEKAPFHLEGPSETLLQVSLPQKAASERARIEMAFELHVPYNNGRMSYNDHAMWLGNWLPILSVKEAGVWRNDPYSPIGDPFYSDMANYHLRVQLPEGYKLATSGLESVAVVTQTRPERQTTYEIDAWNVRDFALVVMDDTYRETTGQIGDTLVRTWSQEGDEPTIVSRLHQVAMQALRYYSEQFGAYPYKEYDMVKTGGFFGGMEYPGLVFIQNDFFDRTDPMGDMVVAHETAHQWFYGLVGNDEVREAWVDESLTDYAAITFMQQYDASRARDYVNMRNGRARAAEAYAKQGLSVWQDVGKFPDWKSYSDLVYARAGAMWIALRGAWGTERLNHMLRSYVTAHQYGQASGKQVVELLSKEAGADATAFIDYWLQLKLEKAAEAKAWLERSKHE